MLGEQYISVRERLEAIMLFRVLIVTVFLGSAIIVDISTLSSISEPRNFTLISLIIGTYLCTILYALILNKVRNILYLAHVQLAIDLLITTTLVLVTGGIDSVFIFVFHVAIIHAAVVTGRSGALSMAAATTLSFGCLGLASIGMLPVPEFFSVDSMRPTSSILFDIGMNSSAAFLIALLAGYLADRLGEATTAIEQQQYDIQELRALNRDILASLDSGLIAVDSERQIIYFNQAAAAILGWQPSAEHHKDSSIPDTVRQLIASIPPGKLPLNHPQNMNFQSSGANELYLSVSYSILHSSTDTPPGHIIVFQDISDIYKLEQQIKRAEHLAAIGQLSAAIAHEIRNPLASISGSVEMLQDIENLDRSNKTLMEIIIREVDRLDHLISDFLEYSRPRNLDFHAVSLCDILADIQKLIENHPLASQIDLEISYPQQNARCMLDREAIQQVCWNILINAIDAANIKSNPSIQIRVDIYSQRIDASTAWIIAIEDNGPGVDDKSNKRIFEPFYTTKYQGTGLGLATSYRIVEQHGGELRLAPPKLLNGCRFEIQLPEILPRLTHKHLDTAHTI